VQGYGWPGGFARVRSRRPGGELGAFTARTKAMTRRVGSPRLQNASVANEDEQRDQNGERADDDPRHPGHSERQHRGGSKNAVQPQTAVISSSAAELHRRRRGVQARVSWSVCLDAVAAGGLCLVEGGVGAGQQLVQVGRVVFGLVVSEADGHGNP